MSTAAPSRPAGAGPAPEGPRRPWLSRANPAAKLIAAFVAAIGLIVAIDPVTSGVVLAVALALVPFARLGRRVLLRLGVPLLLMSLSIGLVNAVVGEDGPVAALGVAVRLLAIAVPGVLAAATTDPTEMADALVQRLRVPERPAMGALAALRLLPLLAGQWRTLSLARRARGLDAGANPVRAGALFAGKTFALLVRAVRTGTLLATAMDARAFGTGPRSHARVSVWRASDTALVAGSVAVVAAGHALSIALGTWQVLFG
ncbi:energy-coupling factor transporter transmembrane component T family protein [Allonocardiopsis opalescens]|uniref:Energy-coupling factor transport system permease protein n=1 Tax=Allonocardiopsis opalescens TaxID=1144618 RepID=A0A2T0PXG7_9ACTN|nr:energy-coupling factor transporter transmembrane component T [Allonocardiopsis opalescens]PRX96221.1 energy-coupling factor transport system permease protein [Allonocardiopsis opalescens]